MITKKTEYLSALIALAKADGEIDQTEMDLINEIAFNKGWTSADIQVAMKVKKYEPQEYFDWSMTEKFEFFQDLILLMKIDGKIFSAELDFVSRLSYKLGYNDADLVDCFMLDQTIDEQIFEEKLQALLA